ncbi:SpoIIE family protein phosphatase [Saccharothrix longispora]|uniref:PAS domain-containing protein n=1 Tax=Saccharothrix longispora TaxID=33920 RepID=A0ABU1PQI3_9PSEU|nr:SpoIIE family protein phosphatase [Saccharothrix longispora]MDR6592900.1 PAS domain-containing protein [Saccharothrix longispora]
MHTPRLPDGGPPVIAPPTGHGAGLTRLAATVERLSREVREAHAVADGRALMEMAKGVLVERLGCGPAEASRQLSLLAEQSGTGLLEFAAEVVNQAARDRLTEAADDLLGDRVDVVGAREPARSAAVRLRTAESGALVAGDTQAVAESLFEHALAPLGATAIAVWSVAMDASLTLRGSAGFAPDEARRWHHVPPGVATPARRALNERSAVWLADLGESGLPSIGGRDLTGARVTAPAESGGRVVGVLEICWPHPLPPQPPQIRRQVEALAELCAHTLDTTPPAEYGEPVADELVDLADTLLDAAFVLRPHLSPTGELADFRIYHANNRFVDLAGRPRGAVTGMLLLEAYPLAAGEGALFDKVERVHATGEPFRAERMALTALVDQVPLTAVAEIGITRHGDRVLVVWRVEDETTRLADLLHHAQRLGRIGGFEEEVGGRITWNSQLFALYGLEPTDDPVPLSALPDHCHPDDTATITRFLRTVLHYRRPGSAAFRFQRHDGIVRHIRVIAEPVVDDLGDRLLAVRGAYQDVSAQHWTEVALSATRDRLAHTEQHAAEQSRLALQLQRAIMPLTAPSFDAFDLRVAVRYRPAEQEHLVGGDWYDAVVLPSKHVLVSVGDITGHGIKGATGMVVLRNALRGLAATGAGPAQLLGWLNLVAHHLTDHIFATAVCALYEPDTRVLRWARAGHPPPVLIRDGQPSALSTLRGIMLGAISEAEYEEGELVLRSEDTLLLYTDGLIERRDTDLDECLGHLLTDCAAEVASLDDRLDHLLAHSRADTDDDTCVVGIQLT